MAHACTSIIELVPSIMCASERQPDFTDVLELYEDDLPSPQLFVTEQMGWKEYWSKKEPSELPNTCAKSLKVCDRLFYPNIFVLLQLICTIPATSCECERSASALRRLHTFNRACMTEERLSSLALIHIHYQKNIDLDEVVDIFSNLHPRRIQLDHL